MGLAFLLLLIPSVANADEDPAQRAVVHDRRAGLVLGYQAGIGLAGADGYPNDVKLLGDPAYYSKSPLLVGQSHSFFAMGAFTDWLSFGPVVNVATFESSDWKSTGFGIGFRLETFPLLYWKLPDAFRDLGVYAQVGIGKTELRAKGDYPDSDGTQSFLGIGAQYEFRLFQMLGGHVAGGPFLEYDATRTDTSQRHFGSLGFRIAFYGGTVNADSR